MTTGQQVGHTHGVGLNWSYDADDREIRDEYDGSVLFIAHEAMDYMGNLAAAAPALLAALEAIAPQYMAFIDQGAGGIHHQGDREQYLKQHNTALEAAYTAIAQARGED